MNKSNVVAMQKRKKTAKVISSEEFESRIGNTLPEAELLWNQYKAQREIADIVKTVRLANNFTQAELAAESEIDKAVISRVENAKGTMPTLKTIGQLVSACGAVMGLTVTTKTGQKLSAPLLSDAQGNASNKVSDG